ncbi:MAG: hypothetical protein V7634_1331 [Bradyrhizobium sp.]
MVATLQSSLNQVHTIFLTACAAMTSQVGSAARAIGYKPWQAHNARAADTLSRGNLFQTLRMCRGDATMQQVEAANRNDLISHLA